MLHKTLLRASDPAAEASAVPPVPVLQNDSATGLELAQLASALASHTDADIAGDLALDLILNEIVEEARLETSASGAAAGLMRGEELICRASSGNAPQLGMRLNLRRGLFAACFSTGGAQLWHDDGDEFAADSASYRQIGVRAILTVPVLEQERVIGVLAVFSADPGAFGQQEVQTLFGLARRIAENLGTAAATPALPAPEITNGPVSFSPAETDSPLQDIAPGEESSPELVEAHFHDYYTDFLTIIVVCLALLLGWMVGRAGWQEAKRERLSAAPPARPAVTASESDTQPQFAPPTSAVEAPKSPSKPAGRPSRKASVGDKAPAPGELVVYEKGKEIFRSGGVAAAGLRSPQELGASTQDASGAGYAALSDSVAESHLVRRVEPLKVGNGGVDGRVVMDVFVGKDGVVEDVKSVSGAEQLTATAIAAVKQWRYRPYAPAGSPLKFKTRVTLNFPAQ